MAETKKTSISPMLSVRRGVKAIEFYKAAFGATELFRIGDEDNAVVAQMAVAGAEFWLADESPQYLNFSPESLGGSTVRMVMVVDDPDEVFTHAVAAGASVVSARYRALFVQLSGNINIDSGVNRNRTVHFRERTARLASDVSGGHTGCRQFVQAGFMLMTEQAIMQLQNFIASKVAKHG
jgi:PhnB protein